MPICVAPCLMPHLVTYLVPHFPQELHPIIYLDELYLGTRSDILDVIRLHESEEEILIIGHNLGLSELASYLLGKDVLMKTSGFISIAFPGLSVKEISNSTGELILSHRCDL